VIVAGHHAPVNDLQLGLGLRAARLKRHLRQVDLAGPAGVSPSVLSRIEHGDFERVPMRALRRVAGKLGVTLEIVPRSAGGEFERVLNARHAALGESVAAWIAAHAGWVVAPEVSFSIYGERGSVDLMAWHEATGLVVVIELKTAIVDVDELLGTLDRKRRLAISVAASRGWEAGSVSVWLLISSTHTNRRRVGEHGTLLKSALPRDGRAFAPVFAHPERGAASGIAFWPNLPGAKVSHPIAAVGRVARPRKTADGRESLPGAPSVGHE
jgi:transcriptional regulator with XRE-family HTH domain